jgi:adenylate cyclase
VFPEGGEEQASGGYHHPPGGFFHLGGDPMPAGSFKRKLTTILSADVKGYSRLMGEDEEWTVHTLNTYKDMMRGLIQQHRGRIVDATGDNVLAEFASVVDAVQCAVEIQQVLRAKNALLPETRRMDFRIGINLGDVIEEKDMLYGDGVNIAARLEGLAEAGGICISGSAYEQIENKLPLRYDYLGEHAVKNIAKPVRVYKAQIEPEVAPSHPPVEMTSREKMAFPMPDKPSIAVLPFVNMSRDPEQEFFSDGITKEIITALSKIPNLLVISHNSTFTYKGKPVKVKQVSEELGVRCVLEGSVQKSADRVRITAQLIDALSGHHLWAERYDRDLKDIFALQDEITMKIITALQVKLTSGEIVGTIAKGTKNIDAFIKYLQAYELIDSASKEGNAHARKILEEAIALDPEYSRLYEGLAMTHIVDVWYGTTESTEQSLARAFELAQKAISLDDSNAVIHCVLAVVYAMKKQYDKAIAACERAVSLDPNSAENIVRAGTVLNWAGRAEEAIPYLQNAIRLKPLPPAIYFVQLANSYRDSGQYEKAIEACKKALQREPNTQFAYIHMAVSYIRLGQEKEARAAAAEILRINPKFSLESYAKILPFPQPIADLVINDLRKAGLK